ncbi:MAG: hypothetical protein J2P55_17680, partial [Rhizobiales bacterium]|nr:hypothetical protein [Hyphomicrobiales bacterium]
TVVVGYSLGANSSVFVANKAKYVDVIIALQPSMLSWNPAVTGRVGRMIEVYNPNPAATFGGMGSKKLIGPNIEYIANNDSHPGAQFNSDFRNLVKSEIARVSAEPAVATAQAPTPSAPMTALAYANPAPAATMAQGRSGAPKVTDTGSVGTPRVATTAEVPIPTPRPHAPAVTKLAVEPPLQSRRREDAIALLDAITSAVDSGNLFAQRQLTVADMMDYATRNYRNARTAELLPTGSEYR